VPVGGGKVYAGRDTVVTQPRTGEYVGLTATCPHQGREVGAVTGGVVECGYHGSLFSIEDGSVVHGPATKPLLLKGIQVVDGGLYLS
jgi:nitrite reductase/ring-hydroxylating ferredoxin subunit